MLNLYEYIKNNTFEFFVILSIIFFLLIIIFRNRIINFLEGRQELDLQFNTYKNSLNKNSQYISSKRFNIPKKNERKCREIFEKLYNKPFTSQRPNFMKRRINNKNLELDGYNHELRIAFEYNGVQHYKYSPLFHKTRDDFNKQLERDIEKRELCKLNNIHLIEIPYTIKYDNLEKYIIGELKTKNLL
jgi:hypothetical protein